MRHKSCHLGNPHSNENDINNCIGLHDIKQEEDAYLLEILDKVRLCKLAARVGGGDPSVGLGVEEDWSKMLSLGEQQRLAFARVLYNQPQVVVLDESTSALDLETERVMYNL